MVAIKVPLVTTLRVLTTVLANQDFMETGKPAVMVRN